MAKFDPPRIKASLRGRLSRATPVLWVVLFGLTVRCVALAARWDRLLADPDSYWRYARAIWYEGTYLGSAYRPPVYPLMLSLAYMGGEGGRQIGVAILHLVLAGVAMAATMACARRLGFSRGAAVAAGLFVAADPLAVYWVTEVMTETGATALVSAVLLLIVIAGDRKLSIWCAVAWMLVGLFGAATLLTRPDVGLGVLLLAVAASLATCRGSARRHIPAWLGLCGGLVLVWGPWMVRNYWLSGDWVPLTTHGGYTAALGNNRLWYSVLRQRGLLATYRPEELRELQAWLLRGFRASRTAASGDSNRLRREIAFDRYCYSVAVSAARGDKRGFIRSACQRLIALWRLAPARPLPAVVRWLLAVWYLGVFAAGAAAVWQAIWQRYFLSVAPLVVLALTLTAVHVVYWSDMRMRTPLAPAFALAIAFLWERGRAGGLRGGSDSVRRTIEHSIEKKDNENG